MLIFQVVIKLTLLLFVPGLITILILKRYNLTEGDYLEEFMQSFLFSFCWTSLVGLILAHNDNFSLNLLLVINIFYIFFGSIVLLKGGSEPVKRSFIKKFNRKVLNELSPLILIIILFGFIFFRPFEYIISGDDCGVYVIAGVNLAKTGSFWIKDQILCHMEDKFKPLFYSRIPNFQRSRGVWGFNVPGFYIADAKEGIIIPRTLMLYPIWLAIFYSLFGLSLGVYLANPLFSLLFLSLLYIFLRNAFNFFVSITSTILYGINILTIWFARYLSPVVLSQICLWGGIFTFFLYIKQKDRFCGFLSAFCLALCMFCGFDLSWVIILVFVGFIFAAISRPSIRFSFYFILPFLAILFYALIQMMSIVSPYLKEMLFIWSRFSKNLPWLIGAYSLILICLLTSNLKFSKNFQERLKKIITIGLSLILVLLFVYAYFIRPYNKNFHTYFFNEQGGKPERSYREENLFRLGWYLTQPMLFLSLVGVLLTLQKKWNYEYSLYISAGIFSSVFYLYDMQCEPPLHFWAMRRFLVMVVPFSIICSCYAISFLKSIFIINKNIISFVVFAILIIIFFHFLKNSLLIINHREFNGFIGFLNKLADKIKEADKIILFGNAGIHFQIPFQVIFNLPAIMYIANNINPPLFEEYLLNCINKGEKFLLIKYKNEEFSKELDNLKFELAETLSIALPKWDKSITHFPRNFHYFHMNIEIYNIKIKN